MTPQRPPMTLVLWDVDHTLIETRGVGRAIYDRAFLAATGTPLRELANVAGRTERAIMSETLRLNGFEPTDNALADLAASLARGYEDARDELRTVGRALPWAERTLQRLAADPLVHQTVLSGNLRSVARIKLRVFGLEQYLHLESGAYGDDHTDRSELIGIARRRAKNQTNTYFDKDHTVVVGDTPNDVVAASTAGVRVIGVATGQSTEADLRHAGADTTVTNLENFPLLLNCRDPQ